MSTYVWFDAYLIRNIQIKIPHTNKTITIPALMSVRVNPTAGQVRILGYQVDINPIDYRLVC